MQNSHGIRTDRRRLDSSTKPSDARTEKQRIQNQNFETLALCITTALEPRDVMAAEDSKGSDAHHTACRGISKGFDTHHTKTQRESPIKNSKPSTSSATKRDERSANRSQWGLQDLRAPHGVVAARGASVLLELVQQPTQSRAGAHVHALASQLLLPLLEN